MDPDTRIRTMLRERVIAEIAAAGTNYVILPGDRLLEYSVAGPAKGFPCLMLLGTPGTCKVLLSEAFQPLFKKHNLKMITPCYPHFGMSDDAPPGHTMDAISEDMMEVMRAEDDPKFFFVCARSTGMLPLVHLLQHYPTRIAGVLALHGLLAMDHPSFPPDAKKRFEMFAGPCLGPCLQRMIMPGLTFEKMLDPLILAKMRAEIPERIQPFSDDLQRTFRRRHTSLGVMFAAALTDAMSYTDMEAVMAAYPGPAVIAGAEDDQIKYMLPSDAVWSPHTAAPSLGCTKSHRPCSPCPWARLCSTDKRSVSHLRAAAPSSCKSGRPSTSRTPLLSRCR